MSTFIGHFGNGMFFCIIGLWHMFNNTMLHAINPKSYTSNLLWFPTSKIKYLELYFIMLASIALISTELFILPHRHHPLDADFTIPSKHLHNFEHSDMALSAFTYAFFALVLDKVGPPAHIGLTHMLAVLVFAQEFFLFHVHSTDHIGLEGQYHWLLQIVLFVLIATSLLSFKYSESFLLGFARSLAILSQGAWIMVIGFMVYIPRLIPEGCISTTEQGRNMVHCHDEESLHRAKSLANIMFSWYMVWMSIFGVIFYLVVLRLPAKQVVSYQNIMQHEDGNDLHDIESRGGKCYKTGSYKFIKRMTLELEN